MKRARSSMGDALTAASPAQHDYLTSMTFPILSRCPKSGQFGAAVSTSSIAVGARVPYVRTRIGGVLTQYRTDPRLGLRGLDLLESGCAAQETLSALVASNPQSDGRQLAVMDASGRTATST